MAIRQPLSTGTSESSIIFYNGGHKHDGISSARIDTAKYSFYDFTANFSSIEAIRLVQEENSRVFRNVISEIVKTSVLGPSGITLSPNSVRAENISAGAVGASELAANIVLVNNIIRSNSFDGTVLANGAITTEGTTGWAISGQGQAVFSAASIRGTISAGALFINNYNYWAANGEIYVGDVLNEQPGFAYSPTSQAFTINGQVKATSGRIAAFDIIDSTLRTGDQFIGWIQLGPVENAGYNGVDAGEIAVSTRDPADDHQVTASIRGEYVQVIDNNNNALVSYMDKNGFFTNGIVACDAVATSGIVYQWGAEQITFKWDGSTFYAVIDGNEYALAASGGAPATTSPATTSPATTTTTSPGCAMPLCNGECCAEGQWCFTLKGDEICL